MVIIVVLVIIWKFRGCLMKICRGLGNKVSGRSRGGRSYNEGPTVALQDMLKPAQEGWEQPDAPSEPEVRLYPDMVTFRQSLPSHYTVVDTHPASSQIR